VRKLTSIRLSDEVAAKLDQLAAALDRPQSWLIEQAVARYVDEEAEQVLQIQDALADYRAGRSRLVPHDDVVRRLDDKLRAKLGDADPLG